MPLGSADKIAAELVRALRGRRSRIEFSRRLGYRSNIVRRWEAGECWPTASDFLQACVRVRPRTNEIFTRFFQRAPDWWDPVVGFSVDVIAAFLRELRGKTAIGALSEQTGFNRFSVSRWLTGKAQPRLPEFLRLVEVASRRMLDFIAGIVDPAQLPSAAGYWQRLKAAREAAYESPWSHAVLRALELDSPNTRRSTGWIAARLGVEMREVETGLEILERTGQVEQVRGQWRVNRVLSVDTSADPVRARKLKIAWSEVALNRLRDGHRGNFGYSLFSVSRRDLRRLRDLHLEYLRAMQNLIAQSVPGECVGLYCAQLMDLAAADNALGP